MTSLSSGIRLPGGDMASYSGSYGGGSRHGRRWLQYLLILLPLLVVYSLVASDSIPVVMTTQRCPISWWRRTSATISGYRRGTMASRAKSSIRG